MADPTLDRVFTFIATNSNTTMECHAFLCPKKKIVNRMFYKKCISYFYISSGPVSDNNNSSGF